jgi:hypothetical protein
MSDTELPRVELDARTMARIASYALLAAFTLEPEALKNQTVETLIDGSGGLIHCLNDETMRMVPHVNKDGVLIVSVGLEAMPGEWTYFANVNADNLEANEDERAQLYALAEALGQVHIDIDLEDGEPE